MSNKTLMENIKAALFGTMSLSIEKFFTVSTFCRFLISVKVSEFNIEKTQLLLEVKFVDGNLNGKTEAGGVKELKR